jgi:DNA-binding NarL/FixJ family response regulator
MEVWSMSAVRILVVDDFEPFRQFIISTLHTMPELQVICTASDGFEAVQRAEELQPDVIVLDIGLPGQSGIAAGRQIRRVAPESKIIFMTQESSGDIVREALSLGALGYVVKNSAGSDLLAAVEAVRCDKEFLSGTLAHDTFTRSSVPL